MSFFIGRSQVTFDLMNVISLTDALQVMTQVDRHGNSIPFSIEFYTWNERGKDCGRVMSFPKVELVSIVRGKRTKVSTSLREINHWKNATRNIRQIGTDNITTVHIWLITKINGLSVKWHIHG